MEVDFSDDQEDPEDMEDLEEYRGYRGRDGKHDMKESPGESSAPRSPGFRSPASPRRPGVSSHLGSNTPGSDGLMIPDYEEGASSTNGTPNEWETPGGAWSNLLDDDDSPPNSADVTPDVTPDEDPRWARVKVDVPVAKQRPSSAMARRPSSPYERAKVSPLSEGEGEESPPAPVDDESPLEVYEQHESPPEAYERYESPPEAYEASTASPEEAEGAAEARDGTRASSSGDSAAISSESPRSTRGRASPIVGARDAYAANSPRSSGAPPSLPRHPPARTPRTNEFNNDPASPSSGARGSDAIGDGGGGRNADFRFRGASNWPNSPRRDLSARSSPSDGTDEGEGSSVFSLPSQDSAIQHLASFQASRDREGRGREARSWKDGVDETKMEGARQRGRASPGREVPSSPRLGTQPSPESPVERIVGGRFPEGLPSPTLGAARAPDREGGSVPPRSARDRPAEGPPPFHERPGPTAPWAGPAARPRPVPPPRLGEDPPEGRGIADYRRNERAADPEGYRQRDLFPDALAQARDEAPRRSVSHEAAVRAAAFAAGGGGAGTQTFGEGSGRSDDYDRRGGDLYYGMPGGTVTLPVAGGSERGRLDVVAEDAIAEGESGGSSEESGCLYGGDISVVSDDVMTPSPNRDCAPNVKASQYEVKRVDSMEDDMKVDLAGSPPESGPAEDGPSPRPPRRRAHHPYKGIKRNDSLEEMEVDFDKVKAGNDERGAYRGGLVVEEERQDVPSQSSPEGRFSTSIPSPPEVRREPMRFGELWGDVDGDVGGDSSSDSSESSETDSGEQPKASARASANRSSARYASKDESVASEMSYSSDTSTEYSSDGYDDYDDDKSRVSEVSDDPTVFPSAAVARMNLQRSSDEYDGNQRGDGPSDDDLVDRACRHLARGRDNAALAALAEALRRAGTGVDLARERLDAFLLHRRIRRTSDVSEKLLEDEEEDELDRALRDAASNMADTLNNIGVVYELRGDCHRAAGSFRDALEAYRDTCRRYENAGDADVDRTVGNILRMGMAARSQEERRELHREAEEIKARTANLRASDVGLCAELRLERLRILTRVLDLEAEGLGSDHPVVGRTLLERGALQLELGRVDAAIEDTKDAGTIMKRGLGNIHPDVGLALVKLADIFNYHAGPQMVNKDAALALYQEALTPLRESFGPCHPRIGAAHNIVGVLREARGELRRAMVSFYDALAGYGVRNRPSGDEGAAPGGRVYTMGPEVFFVWSNIGGLHARRGEWDAALRSYLKSRSAFLSLDEASRERLRDQGSRRLTIRALGCSGEDAQPSFENDNALLAAVLRNIGWAYGMLGRNGRAAETLEEALRLCHAVVAHTARGPLALAARREVARVLQNLGEVQAAGGDLTTALGRYARSLELLRQCETSGNYRGRNSDLGMEAALVLGAIGKVHLKKGEYAEARVVMRECMRTFEGIGVPQNNLRINELRSCLVDSELALVQNATLTMAGQRHEISSLTNEDRVLAIDEIADACRNAGDGCGAIWFYSEALSIRRRRAENLPIGSRRDSEVIDVGKTVTTIASLRRDRREFAAAKILFDEARDLFRSVGLSTNHPFWKDLSHEIELMRKM
ncbi:hypothetical protein ACHAWF_013450 [Thalassiosira exigua]